MIRSMTGFGTSTLDSARLRGSVSVRSVNHRFLDLNVHLAPTLQALEPEVRKVVQGRLRRGRVEVFVQARAVEPAAEVRLASPAAIAALTGALRRLQAEHGLAGELRVSDVSRFPGMVQVTEEAADPEPMREDLLGALARALDGLESMRRAEGAGLEEDLRRLLDAVDVAAARLGTVSDAGKAQRREALGARVRALREEIGADEPRLFQEIVRLVEKHDVAEEIQRLKSHVAQARSLVGGQVPCGKELDFLAQEMGREANTMGSKSASAQLAQEVVALKSEIERLREQVQNVE
jgi:uncharacterized protein (TIGR00255 family)